MDKGDMLFYNEYQEFYETTKKSRLFSEYCEGVFGLDFSQDGFSTIKQVDDLISIAKIKEKQTVLDIGCGNGKMLEYINEKTGVEVYGFDYSENAIQDATERTAFKKDYFHFETGSIGNINYKPEMFDTIISVDTMYFANNLSGFVQQIHNWLKPNGIFLCFYGEGHLKPKSKDQYNTELAEAFDELKISYEVLDYNEEHYELMKHKRLVADKMKQDFIENNMELWYHCAIDQSIDDNMTLDEFVQHYNRYLYIIRK